jgi:hypothetical protein
MMCKSLEHPNCKVKKETGAPRRRYGPKVRMDGGCYTMYTMYTRNPSLGGGTPGGTPVIQILKPDALLS